MQTSDEVRRGASSVVRGRIRTAAGGWSDGQIWVADGRVALVEHELSPVPEHVVLRDHGSSYVIPGAVDGHVHSYSHDGEGFVASTSSAAAGGVTTIVEMPFDASGAVNTRDRFLAKEELANTEARVDVALLGTLAPEGGWRELEGLRDAGAKGFKVSLFLTDPVRFPRIDDRELLNVMAAVAANDTTLCTHAENNEIIQALLREERESGRRDVGAHARSRPPISEGLGVLTAMEIAHSRGTRLHLCHLSSTRSIELLSWYREQGADITAETCPHYLSFTEEDLGWAGGRLKINPPLRSAHDREMMWDGLANGRISVVTSDHAPWPVALKDEEYVLDNHSGVPGVQTIVPLVLGGSLKRGGEDLMAKTLDALTIEPARRYGIDDRKGSLEVGKDADIAVFSPDEGYAFTLGEMHSNAGFTPYEGYSPGGRIEATYVRGAEVFAKGRLAEWRQGQGAVL